MSSEWVGALALGGLLLLLMLRVPVALAMVSVATLGFAVLVDGPGALAMLKGIPLDVLASQEFSAIPLFILMGVLAAHSGMAGGLFRAIRTVFGGFRGGLAIATIASCGLFASVSGSSLATATTMTRVALPSMEKYGTDPGLACGALAAGGTLGIMIPPSIALLIYAILTEQSVGDLFLAGVIPGVLGMLLYSLAVVGMVRWKPHLAKAGERSRWRQKGRALGALLPLLLMFMVLIGGMYLGLFTATEGAAVGAFVAWGYALVKGMRLAGLWACLHETLALSAVVFFMLVAAQALGYFISVSQLSFTLSEWIATLDWPVWAVLLIIIAMYFVLGMFMDAIAMLVVTVPVIYPLIQWLGVDPVYFGIITVLSVELGLITPPVGMNVFVIKAMAPHIPLRSMYRGVLPFIAVDFLRLGLLIGFPFLTLALVN